MFATPKRAVISTICIMAVLLAVLGGIFAAVSRNGRIGRTEAGRLALADAGLEEAQVSGLRVREDHDDGQWEYEVDFYSDGAEYEYVLRARDGEILSREMEGESLGQGRAKENRGNAGARESQASQTNPAGTEKLTGEEISPEDALAAALADAGLSEGDVTLIREETDYVDGVKVYDIGFYTDEAEYDYEVRATDGSISGRDIERFPAQPGSGAGGNAPEGGISADSACEIALEHAGLDKEEVRFAKTELDLDDGREEYEIEFFYGGIEYSYTVDAVSGEILEYEADRD